MTYDLINGAFELVGAVATWANVIRLKRDRHVQGVNWLSMAFFAGWGFWNCAYYPSLHQLYSTIGGCFLAVGNLYWVTLAVRLRRQQRQGYVPAANDQTSDGPHQMELFGQVGSSIKSS